MSKNVDHLQHVKSNVVENGLPKLPQPSVLVEGELAVNYATGFETISLKNSSGDVITFSSDNYYTEKKLGSGFTGENSAVTVTDVVDGISVWEKGTGTNSAVLKNSNSTASGTLSVAEGSYSRALGYYSHAEGHGTASGNTSHAEGNASAYGDASHAEGNGVASGTTSHAEGDGVASGMDSHAEGSNTLASGNYSHAEGANTSATTLEAHAEGIQTLASNNASHAEGNQTTARGMYSHSEGSQTTANAQASHSEGEQTIASGSTSHAEGYGTRANGSYSHAEGKNTITNNEAEHASGAFNVSEKSSDTFGNSGNTLFSVGNGTANDARSNAFEIRQNGDIYVIKGGNAVLLQDEIGVVEQAITTANSASTNAVATKVVAEIEQVTSAALNSFNDSKVDVEVFNSHSGNTDIHVTSAEKSAWNAKQDALTIDSAINASTSASTNPVSTSAVYGFVTAYTPSITVDQVIDNTTSASTNPVSTAAVFTRIKEDEETIALSLNTLNNNISAHTNNNNIHVTTAQTASWNAKVDTSALSVYADSVKYDSTGKTMTFYHGGTGGTAVYSFDASPFIIDGMVENVEIEEVAGSGTCLVVSFNTDAGKQDINIPISDIFDANNYYDKTAIDDKLGSGFTSSSVTEVIESNERVIAASLNDLDDRKADTSAVTSAITDALETLTLASSAVTSMAGYTMAASGTPITSADTLNQAIGKLEKQNDEIVDFIEEKELAIAAALTDLDDSKLDKSANKVTVTAITTNISSSCSITGVSNNGNTETIIYTNSTNSNLIVTVPTTYKTPNNIALEVVCVSGGYCEVSYLNVNGVIYARAI